MIESSCGPGGNAVFSIDRGLIVALTDIDRDLLTRCLANEAAGWRDFVDRFYGLFTHVVNHTSHSRSVRLSSADIDDLCAEVFLTVLANDFAVLRAFEGRCSLATYLTVIARRIVVREISQRRMAEALGHVTAHQSSISRVTGDNPDVQRVDDRDQVQRMLRGLGEREARVIREYHLEGRSYSEISARIGVPENSIGPTLARARAEMRDRELA